MTKYNTKIIYDDFFKLQDNPFVSLNIHAKPSISKVTISLNLSSLGSDKKVVESALKDLAFLSGSRPVVVKAPNSDAAFKIREGQPYVVKVTLRGESMFSFLDKLIYIALPRVRDFRGLKASFDKAGNFTTTLPGNSSLFFESNFIQDLNISIALRNSSPDKSKILLTALRVPFFN